MHQPEFTFDDIRFADGPATFERARKLYQTGKVKSISETRTGYAATVQGTHPYSVRLSRKRIDEGNCDCYLGQHEKLCKHMLALGLAVLSASGKTDKTANEPPAPVDLAEAKKLVNAGMQKLQPYNGPSHVWFNYQRRLATGAGIIAHAVSALPPTRQNADYLWRLIERIDRKLLNGVDDSDGFVGDSARQIIQQLAGYVKQSPQLKPVIRKHTTRKTNFNFEIDLQSLL